MTGASAPAPGTPHARVVLPPRVWLLEHGDKYGSTFTAHADEAGALAEAAEIARDGWADLAPSHADMPPTPDGLDDAETVRAYFGSSGRDEYWIHELEIDGALEAVLRFLLSQQPGSSAGPQPTGG